MGENVEDAHDIVKWRKTGETEKDILNVMMRSKYVYCRCVLIPFMFFFFSNF